MKKFNRRDFFRAAAAGGAGLVLPQSALAGPQVKGNLATLLDLSKCIGCNACVEACRETNKAKYPEPVKPFPKMYPEKVKVEDFSDKRGLDTRLTPYNWLYVQNVKASWQGKEQVLNIPRRCMHCVNPPCANLCPFGAAAKEENGTVRINPSICFGGAKCRDVCPWAVPQRQTGVGLYLKVMPSYAGNGVMFKCDRCFERVAEGKLPACIEVCPQEVQQIGPREEMLQKAKDLAKAQGGYLYGESENGGTNTFYVSPIPFEALDAAAKKGPGQPGLGKYPDPMAKESNLAFAVFLAPLAGAASLVLRGLRNFSSKKQAGGKAKEGGDE